MIRDAADLPRIALVLGDPAGVGAEIAARVLADADAVRGASISVLGDARQLEAGARVAGVTLPGIDLQDTRNADPQELPLATASAAGGRAALENFSLALDGARAGAFDAVTFTPFNKQALRLGGMAFEDELRFAAHHLGHDGPVGEFNVLEKLWNARVTSHVPLAEVAALLSVERIVAALRLTDASMRAAGFRVPRIAVAALNPHAGDGGAFGREEIDIIAPAVGAAQQSGITVDGPYPADTVYLRARDGHYDAVLSMYHDQGQIAIKLLGFERGVTVLGGLPVPVTTPAHGTAYDIAGKGRASALGLRHALAIAASMGASRRATRQNGA